MELVTTTELRREIAHYLDLAALGHTFGITREGKVIAQLGPQPAPRVDMEQARAVRLELRRVLGAEIDVVGDCEHS